MKNISFIIAGLKFGGAERAVSNLSLSLSKLGYNIFLIVFDSSNFAYKYGGKLLVINSSVSNIPIFKVINFIKRYKSIKYYKKKYKIDISISFLDGPNILNGLSKINEKVIFSIRNFPFRKEISFFVNLNRFLLKLLYNKADLIVCVSDYIRKHLIHRLNININKIITVNNFIDIDKIQLCFNEVLENKYRSIFDEKVIITVGRFNKHKGHLHLIKAFKRVVEFDNNVKLVIIGEGVLHDSYLSLIDKLKLERNVFLLGFQENPYKYINNSQIFVLSSITEGFPNVLIEAMGTKIAVISTDCLTGPREILAPGTESNHNLDSIEYAKYGILVPVSTKFSFKETDVLNKDEELLAEAIIHLLKSDIKREHYKEKAKIRAKDFDKDILINRWIEILNCL